MLRLPLPEVGIRAGCNFAAAATLCNLISGISYVLYKPAKEMGSGDRFKELEKYYPWERFEDRKKHAKVIYEIVRNPLSHSMGLRSKSRFSLLIAKNRSSKERIEEMEQSTKRPSSIQPAVIDTPNGYLVSVEGLCWGVIRLVRRLARDTEQMCKANMKLLTMPSNPRS